MATNTHKELFNNVIYSVYVRNHTESGDFKGLISDLDRIADLGIDTIWLMPIHPIGEYERKGALGCPYSIKDYRSINPEYGTLEDFKNLLSEVHARSMKCIMDVVFNHTSKDSELTKSNPEYFMKNDKGEFTCKVDEWSDIADFDFSNDALRTELLDTLLYWCNLGVDGFRCDVAPAVPVDFWETARQSIQAINPNAFLLAETAGLDFVELIRSKGCTFHSDSELYSAFDMAYDYDIKDAYHKLLNDDDYYPRDFAYRLYMQNNTYADNAIKLRFLENHDTKRAADAISNYYELQNYTAMMFFQKGSAMLYAGQETMETKSPSLFEKDTIDLKIKNQDFYSFMKTLIKIKQDVIFTDGFFYVNHSKDKNTLQFCYKHKGKTLNGIFNLNSKIKKITVDLPDGEYDNLLNNSKVRVTKGRIKKDSLPAFIYSK